MTHTIEKLNNILLSFGFSQDSANTWDNLFLLIILILCALIIQRICRLIILKVVVKIVKKTKAEWDDIIFDPKVMGKLVGMIAPTLIYILTPLVFERETAGFDYTQRICMAYVVLMFTRFLSSLLTAFHTIYEAKDKARERPLKGLLQTLQIIIFFIGVIAMISILINKSPFGLLAGLGASAAILTLIFQDSILGLVSGIQLSANNMVHVGDWIAIPKYGVDGSVIEITLNTVKVQNWDKTIVTVPPTALMKESFQNWRGMQTSGGRRVKRSINIDMNSVRFCTSEMLQKYHKIQLVHNYVEEKEKDIRAFNEKNKVDESLLVNGRHQTNLGVLRAYLTQYLKNHPGVNKNMMCMVRQLQPTETGMPIELYFFTDTIVWTEYEGIQADVFDHVLSIIPEFDLRVFQSPTGADFRRL